MVGFTGDQPEFEPTGVATPYPGVSSKVRAVINLYGPANLLTRQEVDAEGVPTGKFRAVGPAAVYGTDNPAAPVYVRASPVTHVTKNSPPVLILHGQIDLTVDRAQSEELAGVLAKHGVPHELVRVAEPGTRSILKRGISSPCRAIFAPWLWRFWKSISACNNCHPQGDAFSDSAS